MYYGDGDTNVSIVLWSSVAAAEFNLILTK